MRWRCVAASVSMHGHSPVEADASNEFGESMGLYRFNVLMDHFALKFGEPPSAAGLYSRRSAAPRAGYAISAFGDMG